MNIGIIANPKKALTKTVLNEMINWLKVDGNEIFMPEEEKIENIPATICSLNEFVNTCDIVIALGGDGTLLKSVRIIGEKEIPILGVNLGGLGFLTEVSVDGLYPAIKKLLKKEYTIEERIILIANIGKNKVYGLNDIVVIGGEQGRISEFNIEVDKMHLSTFLCDGIIISTPTGSTAYSLAAGGPIIYPTLPVIIINFICAHTLGARPLILSSNSVIELICYSSNVICVGDGQVKVEAKKDEKIEIVKCKYKVKLIKAGVYNFYEILRNKLRWGSGKER